MVAQTAKPNGPALWGFFFIALLLFATTEVEAYEVYEDEPSWPDNGSYDYLISTACPAEHVEAIQFWMEQYSAVYPTKYTNWTAVAASARDFNNRFWCSDTFHSALVKVPYGYTVVQEEVKSQTGNSTLGRATFWYNSANVIVEADVQLAVTLTKEELDYVVQHEVGHALGCAHSNEFDAVMYSYVFTTHGMHVDDFKCLDYLYGPLDFTAVGWKGNVFIPKVVKFGEFEGSATLIEYTVTDYSLTETERNK